MMTKFDLSSRRFVILFLILSLTGLLFVAVLNLITDPFNLYKLASIEKFNTVKSQVESQSRLYKAREVVHQRPKAIVLGSSRVMAGLDPEHLEAIVHEPSYNIGFPGATFNEMYEYFLHALHIQPDLKHVIIGIDLLGFNANAPIAKDFTTKRLQTAMFNHEDVMQSLMSYQSLKNSFKTIKSNYLGTAQLIFKTNGQFNPSAMMDANLNIIKRLGPPHYLKHTLLSENFYKDCTLCESSIQKFQQLVAICKQKNITLKAFINPVKACYSEFYHHYGLWPILTTLKQRLCAIHPIWDFSGYNHITTETLQTDFPLYAECSHFTPNTGRLLLERMFDHPNAVVVGDLLTPNNFEQVSHQIEQDRMRWVQENQKYLAELFIAIDQSQGLVE